MNIPAAAARWLAASDPARKERERLLALQAMPPEYVLTLVHGTFAKNAPWIRPDSLIARSLTELLGGRVEVEPFVWTGSNSVHHCATAVAALRDHLGEMRRRYKGARQVVVAHSHGGNVALTAMHTENECQGVLGVVTLATPFLHARARASRVPLDLASGVFAALASGFSVMLLGAGFGHGWTWWRWGGIVAAAVALILLAGKWIAARMHRYAKRIVSDMPRTALPPAQLMIIRTEGDEAAAVISGARVAGACVDLVWRRFSEPLLELVGNLLDMWDYLGFKAFERKFQREHAKIDWGPPPVTPAPALAPNPVLGRLASQVGIDFSQQWRTSAAVRRFAATLQPPEEPFSVTGVLAKYVVPNAGVLTALLLEEPVSPAVMWILALMALLYGLPALMALLVTAVSVPFAVVFAGGLLPCGWGVPLAGPFLDITAEPAPPGTWSVTQVEPNDQVTLAHSKSYDDGSVFHAIAEWVKRRTVEAETGIPPRVVP